jgi:hypothetical protein
MGEPSFGRSTTMTPIASNPEALPPERRRISQRDGAAAVLVDLQDVLSIAEIVVRIERAYDRLKGPVRKHIENLFRTWNVGLSLGGGGFTASLQCNRHVDAESVLLRLLELPVSLFERQGTVSLIVFDEIQDVLAVAGADGKIRSVIQHQTDAATYAFAGSAPGVIQQLFADPKRPLLDQRFRGASRRCLSMRSPTTCRSDSDRASATWELPSRRCWSSPAAIPSGA